MKSIGGVFSMANVVYKTVYFENPSPQNTKETLKLLQ
jgi:hypothetical protein